MPAHDWTRVTAGTFHDFHLAWIAEIRRVLNAGLLPEDYYALAEQVAGDTIPDVLTLQHRDAAGEGDVAHDSNGSSIGGVALADAPPRVSVTATASEAAMLALHRRRLTIRHRTGDRIVALIEIVSPGNKERRGPLESFVDKAADALRHGLHLLVIDLFPPGSFDPQGMHGAIWERAAGTYEPPPGKPLTLAAYRAAEVPTAYVEPIAVGDPLPEMPLFLDPGHYINVPLEPTYLDAWEGVPRRWREVIDPATA